MSSNFLFRATPVALALASCLAHAQQAPDAGQTLQQLQQTPPAAPIDRPTVKVQPPEAALTLPGGAQVAVQSLVFKGQTVLSASVLAEASGFVAGRSYDLAGLRALAQAVADFYRASGYPFARAFIPPQQFDGGTLRIDVLEGRYGAVQAVSADAALAASVQSYLAPLVPGTVIEGDALERVTLLLADLPGLQTLPLVRPGTQTGSGDLQVHASRGATQGGYAALDNHGNYYSGQTRARVGAVFTSSLLLGDELSVGGVRAADGLWLASVAYGAPVGIDGWRVTASRVRTRYRLTHGFEGNEGTAEVTSAGVSYPMVRSRKGNLTVSLSWQEKTLFNSRAFGADTERYKLQGVPVSVQFDVRDSLGGITFGSLVRTAGRLDKNDAIRQGRFNKYNVDVVHLQPLGEGFSLHARASGQAASRNLDSAEGMSLGGANGVRAYPNGEAAGDEGWLAQVELRYTAGAFTPYTFYDQGKVQVNAQPQLVAGAVADKRRAGAGVGVRYLNGAWSLDLALAWRLGGPAPESVQGQDRAPRAWFSGTYRF